MTVELGYLLPTRENIMQGKPAVRPMLDAAGRAADLGIDSIWVGDSLLARPRHDPLTLLAAVGAAVPGVTLGTAVLLPALRNPVLLAHQLATIDQISEGRLVVGAGIAGDVANIRAEFTAAGVPFDGRVGRMMEGFRLCRALWSGEPVTWDGRWHPSPTAPVVHRSGSPQASRRASSGRPNTMTAGSPSDPIHRPSGNGVDISSTPPSRPGAIRRP